MEIDFAPLDYAFATRPLLIGGKAMEYYELRSAGDDIDLVVTAADYEGLARRYPDRLKEIGADLGVCVGRFEVWRSIYLFDYERLSYGAVEAGTYRVISLEKLLLLKAMAMSVPKHHADLERIIARIRNDNHGPWWAQLTPAQQRRYIDEKM
jgi:hypothetical protein